MKKLDTHIAHLIHKEAYGNEINSIIVKVYLNDDNYLIIEPSAEFDRFHPYNSGSGDFILELESQDPSDPDFLFNLTPNNGWTDFTIDDDFSYKKFQAFSLHKKLSETIPTNSDIQSKHKI